MLDLLLPLVHTIIIVVRLMLLETIRALFVFPPHQSSRPTHFALAIAHTHTHTLCTYVLRIVYGPRVANCFQQFKESRCSTFNERPAAWATIRAYCRFHIYIIQFTLELNHSKTTSGARRLWGSNCRGPVLISDVCQQITRSSFLYIYMNIYIYIWNAKFQSPCYVKHVCRLLWSCCCCCCLGIQWRCRTT